ncbi:helix-turn-helix domain-containing protein [Streptomyces sp. NPDC001380]|uniref:helix-turn-helix domain-containing protein n=1 Tax=Streptomyces sp. NPDC001380 TaxID=3364566 RepID=UPI00367D48A0
MSRLARRSSCWKRGRRRRTPGLRREELATLAGVSIDYYTRLERGRETRPSPAVVDSLARALLLHEEEHEHLRRLAARAARTAPEPPAAPSRTVRPGIRILLEHLRPGPAHVLSRTLDVLTANPGGLHLYAGIEGWPARQRNLARYSFLHPGARDLFPEWETHVRGCVARLRALAGTDPDAPDLARLVGELLLKSPEFARLWERYDVRGHRPGTKRFRHPGVGDLTLGYQSMQLEGTPGQRLVVYCTDAGGPDHGAMVLLDRQGLDADAFDVPAGPAGGRALPAPGPGHGAGARQADGRGHRPGLPTDR